MIIIQMTFFRLTTLCLISLMSTFSALESASPAQKALLPVRSTGQTTYYVDSKAGNDANPGTAPDQARGSLERVNHTFGARMNRHLNPGLTAGPTHCRLFEAGLVFIGVP